MIGKRALTAVGLLVLLAGCSGSKSSKLSSGAADGAANRGASTAQSVPGVGVAPNAAARGAIAVSPAPLQSRDIVRTATLDVTVSDVDKAADGAARAAIAAGGRADADDRSSSAADRHAHLVLRVPPARLSALMDSVARGGHENSRTDHGEDVTADTADVGARVAELRISVARLQDFLRRSGNLADLLSLETQLTQRQSELESTIAQQRALADQVSLATLTVDLSATLPPAARTQHGPAGFGSALAGGLSALVLVLRVAAAALGFAAPFLIVLIPAGSALWWLAKRRRASRGAVEPVATP